MNFLNNFRQQCPCTAILHNSAVWRQPSKANYGREVSRYETTDVHSTVILQAIHTILLEEDYNVIRTKEKESCGIFPRTLRDD